MGLSPPKSVVEVRLPGYDWYTEDGLCPSHGRFSQRPRQQVPASPEGGTRRNMPVFCESALLNTTIRSDCIEERQVMRDIVAVIRSSPVAGLCYDTPSGEAVTFEILLQGKSLVKPLVGCTR